jgi:hypothetical protein
MDEKDRDRETVREINRFNALLVRVLGEKRAAQARGLFYLACTTAAVYAAMAPKRWKP